MTNPWNVIEIPASDVIGRRIDHTHPFDLFWGKDYLGYYLFIFESTDRFYGMHQALLPDLVGIKARYLPPSQDSPSSRLVLLLNEQQNWELFYSLCNDLTRATRNAPSAKSALETILRRLERWREFLRANHGEMLSEEKIKGLIGELYFLRKHLIPAYGPGPALAAWQGPERTPQDFYIGQFAIEVKCKSGGTRPYVRISSEFQLCSQLPELYLHVITLGETTIGQEGAVSLPGLIADIRLQLPSAEYEQSERFSDLLFGIGYVDSEAYLSHNYLVIDESTFKVRPGFPCICPNNLSQGVANLTYDINLLDCAEFASRPDWMEET
jgi:hypothetical protein